MTSRFARAAAPIAMATIAGMALWAASAVGERAQTGNIVASLKGDIRPHFLPRTRAVPVSVGVSSDFSTADGSALPQLRTIALGIGGRGKLDHSGLPLCREARIQATTWNGALGECGAALVGRGRMDGEIHVQGQAAFDFHGRMLLFNGRLDDGRPAALADVVSKGPPVSFVIAFVARPRAGAGGTELVARLPRAAGGFVRVSHFDLSLGRRFRYRGSPRSYLNASCAVPAGFTALVVPMLEATYTFAGGHSVTVVASRGCSVRQ
jgi:hypothetical protein